jgi:hypothetical protein
MKKKSKGKTPQQIKQEQAHQKKLYLQKIRSVMDSIASEPAYNLLGFPETETIYLVRLRPLKLKFAESNTQTIPNDFAKFVNDYLTTVLKNTIVTIDNRDTRVNLYDFYTFIETIYLFWRNTTKETFPNAAKFIERFPVFNNGYKTKRLDAFEMVHVQVEHLAWMLTHVLELIVWINPVDKKDLGLSTNQSAFFNDYVVHPEKPESEILDIDGKRRRIFRLGYGTKDGITWLSVTPGKLGKHGVMENFPLKVYIQKHAVDRIKERLGDFLFTMNFFLIINAILECEVYPAEGNSFLLSCKYNSIKLGYFKADIIEDKLLIRTFLFLTNNGAPEGKNLESLLGLQKEDKKYFGIDKLNVFINSDIEQNENLKEMFCQAGCGDLFEIGKYLSGDKNQIIHCADSFAKYLEVRN